MSLKHLTYIINYIEDNLEDEINYKNLCIPLGVHESIIQRMFPFLFNITLTDYIRKRRLTKAAFDLRQTQKSVIDLALKYGYVSADSFTVAFRNHHGYTPSAVRKGAPISIFNALKLEFSLMGGDFFPIEIKTVNPFYVAGLVIEGIENDSSIPELWNKLFQSDFNNELWKCSDGQSYGVCYEMKSNGQIKYMAGRGISDPDKVKHLPVELTLIEQFTFAIIPCVGKVPESIHNTWKYIWEQFFPESNYTYSGNADLEVYSEGNIESPDYKMEIWVPVEKRCE